MIVVLEPLSNVVTSPDGLDFNYFVFVLFDLLDKLFRDLGVQLDRLSVSFVFQSVRILASRTRLIVTTCVSHLTNDSSKNSVTSLLGF